MEEQIQKTFSYKKRSKAPGFSAKPWKQIGKGVLKQLKTDHVQIVSAGVAFYFFLAIFPAIAALLAIYSLAFDPASIQEHLSGISAAMPAEVYGIIKQVINSSLQQSQETLGWSLVISILLSIWSANKGTSAIFEGVNIAYNLKNTRGFLKKTILTLAFTLGTVILGIIGVALVIVFPGLIDKLELPGFWKELIGFLRWVIMGMLLTFFMAAIYRLAPCRKSPKFRWFSFGTILATILWLAGSLLFSWYVENFGTYGEAYGSFAAVIILLLWFFLFSFMVLLGAEVNSEIERHTNPGTTRIMGFANRD
ncbi:YihY/virulence factor BrkB family protein [Gramella sp. GC03-9]|uniref:YihY/virulence factor BrkB family protein n=1 Tax=Christiangramia oceanisediminis TaxID=2920386 RepID=A0A9X2KW74_9FLAO|nr:YihY/virulence factor BrkB family protein [Gramella oceanisediminis]MCP9199004.1 YihY/virulence factor BrkB family protein [Gramella oceanisediminis]